MLLTVLQARGSQKAASTPQCRLAVGKHASMGWSSSAGWLWERSLEHLCMACGSGSPGLSLPEARTRGRAAGCPASRPAARAHAAQQPLVSRMDPPRYVPPVDNLKRALRSPWGFRLLLLWAGEKQISDHLPNSFSVLNTLVIGLNQSNKLSEGNIFPAPAGEAVALWVCTSDLHQRSKQLLTIFKALATSTYLTNAV